MKRLISILMITSAFVLMTACGHKAKVISEDKFIKIYMDMFIADQWLESNYTEKRAADTLLFYDPIFEKHGYNREDYYKTVNHYLRDPQKYLKLMRKVQDNLKARVEDVQKELEVYSYIQNHKGVDRHVVNFASIVKDLAFNDTISIEKDEKGIYSIMPIEFDTIFKGPAIVVKEKVDTTASDSLAIDSTIVSPTKISDEVIKRPIKNPKVRPNNSNKNVQELPLEDRKK